MGMLARIAGGALQGLGEGMIANGKDKREAAREKLREDRLDSRTQMGITAQAEQAGLNRAQTAEQFTVTSDLQKKQYETDAQYKARTLDLQEKAEKNRGAEAERTRQHEEKILGIQQTFAGAESDKRIKADKDMRRDDRAFTEYTLGLQQDFETGKLDRQIAAAKDALSTTELGRNTRSQAQIAAMERNTDKTLASAEKRHAELLSQNLSLASLKTMAEYERLQLTLRDKTETLSAKDAGDLAYKMALSEDVDGNKVVDQDVFRKQYKSLITTGAFEEPEGLAAVDTKGWAPKYAEAAAAISNSNTIDIPEKNRRLAQLEDLVASDKGTGEPASAAPASNPPLTSGPKGDNKFEDLMKTNPLRREPLTRFPGIQ
jgi:hypothetical protein